MSTRRQRQFIEDIEAKQKNTVWPDMLVNSRAVDYLIFRGSRDATRVQRVGIALFGAFFLLAGIAFIGIAHDLHSIVPVFIAVLGFLLGGRLLSNAFRGFRTK
jgi:hypothetical protein